MKLTKFQHKIYKLLLKIPKGKISTYKLLAKAAGRPRNWRQVGKSLSQNPYPCKSVSNPRRSALLCTFPCYKIVKSNGEVGGYNCGKLAKIKLLRRDGIKVYNNRIRNYKKVLFKF